MPVIPPVVTTDKINNLPKLIEPYYEK